MIYPKGLKKGDVVGLVAPAGPVAHMDNVLKFMRNIGYSVIVGESCYAKKGYLAGEDSIRANDLNKMFSNKDVKAVFAVRGGYGCQRMMNMLDFNMIKKNPKIFAGYSDITVLLNAINSQCNFITYHAPMVYTEFAQGADVYTVDSFLQYLERPDAKGEVLNPNFNKMGMFGGDYGKGRICGGNLTLIVSSLATWYEPDLKGKILFLEEVGESPYKIDRMLTQLINSGRLNSIKGIVLGSFKDCEAENSQDSLCLQEVLYDRLLGLGVPVLWGLSAGHVLPSATIPIGAEAKIKSGRLFIL